MSTIKFKYFVLIFYEFQKKKKKRRIILITVKLIYTFIENFEAQQISRIRIIYKDIQNS